MEEWRDIEGYEGLYQVSNYGRVKSVERREKLSDGRYRTRREKIRIVRKNREGYEQLSIWKNSKQRTVIVHRLVANAFLPCPGVGYEVNHKDGNKTNNTLENLEWVTHSYNTKHTFAELGRVGKTTMRKLSPEQVREIRSSTESDRQLSEKYRVARSAIYQIRKRKTYKNVI